MWETMIRRFFPNLPRVERDRRWRELWFSVAVALAACAAVAAVLWLSYYKTPR